MVGVPAEELGRLGEYSRHYREDMGSRESAFIIRQEWSRIEEVVG